AFQQLRRATLENWMEDATLTNPAGAAGDTRTMSAAKGTSWWDKNRATLEQAGVFSPAELNRLELVQPGNFSDQRINTVGKGAASPPRQSASAAQSLDQLLAGAVVPEKAQPFASRLGSLVMNAPYVKDFVAQSQAKGRARLAEAMLNPQVAADLLRQADPVVLDRLTGQLGRFGPALTSLVARA